MEPDCQPCHIQRMETSIIKAVLVETGHSVRVQLYYVTVNHGEDPIFLFNENDPTPDLVAATVIDTLTEEEARGFGFRPGEIRNVTGGKSHRNSRYIRSCA
jgi:hypothetical protein